MASTGIDVRACASEDEQKLGLEIHNAVWPHRAVTMDEVSIQTNYPAILLWNQPATNSNHTPAWDRFQIPDVM